MQLLNYLVGYIAEYFWLAIIFALYVMLGILGYDELTIKVAVPFTLIGFLGGGWFALVSRIKSPLLQKIFLGSAIGSSTSALFWAIVVNVLILSDLISQTLILIIFTILVILGWAKEWISKQEINRLIILLLLFSTISIVIGYILDQLLLYKGSKLLPSPENLPPWTFYASTGSIFGVVLVSVLGASEQLQKKHGLLSSSFILLSTIPLGLALGFSVDLFF
jgi:hypothetical protein